MKRILSFLLVGSILLSTLFVFGGCAKNSLPPEGTTTRMTVDINPSVELMVDDQNKVVSVTALNDDGSILIAGEAIVGKTAEEAVEIIVRLSAETGYLVEGNVSADENTVKISVSGNTEYAEKLRENVAKATDKLLEKLNIEGKAEIVSALELEALRKLAYGSSSFTEEEINAMSEEDLYKVLAAERIETALLLTEDMRKAYYAAKEYEISFAGREETARVIEAMGDGYAIVYRGYQALLESYSNSVTALDDLRYELLVSPESEYQKSLTALREAKTDLLRQKNYVASLEVNGEQVASATVTLQLSEEKYNAALALYQKLGEDANKAMEALISTLRGYETQLAALEERFSDDIKAELTAKATEMEQNINRKKDAFFAEFEEAHKADIQSVKNELIARKQQLIDSVGQS